jgi:hypothetical protein
MKTMNTRTIAILSIVAVALAASTATASGNKKGGFSISFGGGSQNFHNNHVKQHPHVVKKIYVTPTCYRPLHCYVWVLPGDTWYTISLREYGNSSFCHYIASYNGLSMSSPLIVGQQLRLPEIYSNGTLGVSYAPVPAPFVIPQAAAAPIATQNAMIAGASLNGDAAAAATPSANVRPAATESTLPSVAIGSMLVLDGQSFGGEQGIVRLRISSLTLPVEVLEWSASSAKVRLPELELAAAMRAELEVLRADGSLASKSAIQLTPAATRLALGN